MIDIDSIPVVLPDGSLWMEEEAAPTAALKSPDLGISPTEAAPVQSYSGARRGPKPRQHNNKVQHWVDDFARQDMGEAHTPSMNTCPKWLQDIIIGACRLNGSAKYTGKPIQSWMVLKVLLNCEYISTATVNEFFNCQYSDRYVRQITACCISASASIERYFHRLADALAEATGREVKDFCVAELWESLGFTARPVSDDAAWQEEKLRLGRGAAPFIPFVVQDGVKYHQRVNGWFSDDGIKLTAAMTMKMPPNLGTPPEPCPHYAEMHSATRTLAVRTIDSDCIGAGGYESWCSRHGLDPASGFHGINLDTGKGIRPA